MNQSITKKDAKVEIVIPVYNEEKVLQASVERLRQFLQETFPYQWQISIVDNASTDDTWQVVRKLEALYPEVGGYHLFRKGRGRALRHAFTRSRADIVCYMDVDLSTDLKGLLPLISPLVTGHSDIAIGSRLATTARVKRSFKRGVISRTYNLLIKLAFMSRFSDAQCGFKAMRTETARQILPLIENEEWFWDTELLLLAEHNRLRIHEVAVDWVEDPDSRVNIAKTVREDLEGLWRMRLKFWRGEGKLFAKSEPVSAAA